MSLNTKGLERWHQVFARDTLARLFGRGERNHAPHSNETAWS